MPKTTMYPTRYQRERNQAEEAYYDLCRMYPNADALYEETIINAITRQGLYLLKKHNLIEACACRDGERVYAI